MSESHSKRNIYFTITAIIISLLGVYLSWRQIYTTELEMNAAKPYVTICLQEFDYKKGKTNKAAGKMTFRPKGKASFRLINKGGTSVTVTKVELQPFILTEDQSEQGFGKFRINVDQTVPAKGVISLDRVDFEANFNVAQDNFFEEAEIVKARVYWPGEKGPESVCTKSSYSWSCAGTEQEGDVEVCN